VGDIQIDRGALRFADFVLHRPSAVGVDGTTMARDFLADYRDLVRLTTPIDELQVIRRAADDQHIVFRQRHDGIPVYGAELGVYLRGSAVRGVIGRYLPGITTASTPRLSAAQAEALALIASGGGATINGDTQLRYFDRGLLGFRDAGTYLTWMVTVAGRGGHRALLVDAANGEVRYERRREETFNLDLEDDTLLSRHRPDRLDRSERCVSAHADGVRPCPRPLCRRLQRRHGGHHRRAGAHGQHRARRRRHPDLPGRRRQPRRRHDNRGADPCSERRVDRLSRVSRPCGRTR
jgi:fungalysin/thermolysin propeptide